MGLSALPAGAIKAAVSLAMVIMSAKLRDQRTHFGPNQKRWAHGGMCPRKMGDLVRILSTGSRLLGMMIKDWWRYPITTRVYMEAHVPEMSYSARETRGDVENLKSRRPALNDLREFSTRGLSPQKKTTRGQQGRFAHLHFPVTMSAYVAVSSRTNGRREDNLPILEMLRWTIGSVSHEHSSQM